MRRVVHRINEKTQGDLHRLVRTLTRSVSLQVIGYAVKQLYPELCEQGSLKFTKELRGLISDQFPCETQVNQV